MSIHFFDTVILRSSGFRLPSGESRTFADLGATSGTMRLFARHVTVESVPDRSLIDHHRGRPGSPFADVRIAYLFRSWAEAGDGTTAVRRGFTHLIADTKRWPDVVCRLERRVRRDFPERYERACAVAASKRLAAAA